jgi:hypothetical protein
MPRIVSINYFLATYLKLLDHFVLHPMKICVNQLADINMCFSAGVSHIGQLVNSVFLLL